MNLFDYIPQTHFNPMRTDVKYSLRKRIFHPGYALSYCYLPANEDIWILLDNYPNKLSALAIIAGSHGKDN